MPIRALPPVVALLLLVPFAPAAYAAPVSPFVEDFTSNNAGWANFNSSAFLSYFAAGGPDGGSYAAGPRTLTSLALGNTAIAIRARHDDPWNASGDAFHGDWATGGIREVRAWVRHDIPVATSFFMRVAGEANSPGHVYVEGLGSDPNTWKLIQPNTWTPIFFDVSRFSSQLRSAEGSDWDTVFGNVGHLQFGVIVPGGFAADTTAFTIAIDKVAITTPEPTTWLLAAGGIMGLGAWQRRNGSLRRAH